MFQREIEDDHSFASWACQTVLALTVPWLVVVFTTMQFFDRLPAESLTLPIGLCAISVAMGSLVYRLFRSAPIMGQWTWTVPSLLTAFIFTSDLIGSSLRHAAGLVFSANSLVTVLVTYPMLSASAYSVTMYIAKRRWKKEHAGSA